MKNMQFLRVLDANFNRSREGLRFCEEVARFLLNDKKLTALLKKSRHQITDVLKSFSVLPKQLIAQRDTDKDVGKNPDLLEKKRNDVSDIFFANIQRSKESLRVLEEVSKLFDKKASEQLKRIRFQVYDIEKKSLPKLEALYHH